MSEEKQNLQEPSEETQAGMDTFFAEQKPVQQAAAKQGGMSRNVKVLIAGAAVLLLLGGGLTAVLLMQKGEEGSLSSETDSSVQSTTDASAMITLNAGTADTLTKVEISAKSDFTVYRASEATDEADAVYSIEGLEDIPLNAALLSTVVKNGSELAAAELVEENCTDLAKYGLAEPAAEVAMTYADGTVFEFSVGDASPLDTTYTYCLTGGTVYLVKSSLMANYQEDALFFVSKTVLEEPAEDAYPIVESLRIEREDMGSDILLKYAYEDEESTTGGTAATHIMYEPVFAYLNVEKSAEVSNGMFGLSATDILIVHPTEAELAEAGIDAPFCTVTMACDDGNTYRLLFGNTYTGEDGTENYYMYLEGTEVLYGLTAENAVWATMQPGDITSANIFGTYVWDISTLDVTAGEQTLNFVGEGEDKDTYTVTKNGAPCETERFRLLYAFLLSIYGEELCLDPLPDREPDASVHIVTHDGSEDYTVAFYKLDNLNTMVAVNGAPTYKIRSSCLDTIEHNLTIFDTDEEFITTWQ